MSTRYLGAVAATLILLWPGISPASTVTCEVAAGQVIVTYAAPSGAANDISFFLDAAGGNLDCQSVFRFANGDAGVVAPAGGLKLTRLTPEHSSTCSSGGQCRHGYSPSMPRQVFAS